LTTMVDLTKFYAMSEDDLDDLAVSSLAPKKGNATYKFVISDASIGEWESGPYLKLITQVVEGVEKGRNGPQITLSFSPYIGEGEEDDWNERAKGRSFKDEIELRTDRRAAQVFTTFRTLFDGELPMMPDSGDAEEIFEAVEDTIENHEFIGVVRRGTRGFDEFNRGGLHSVSNPPKSYDSPVEEFHI
jgi:hypothetical protein